MASDSGFGRAPSSSAEEAMEDGDKPGAVRSAANFFTTLPGIITAVAALLTAVVGLLTFLRANDGAGSNEELGSWVARINESCQAYEERIDALRIELTAEGSFDYQQWYQDYSGAIDGLVEDVTDDPPPEGEEGTVRAIVRAWQEASDQLFSASFVDTERERGAREAAADKALKRGGGLAAELGAVACEDLG
jgi:hypothetical protein